jgi:hypothetical protein
MCFIYLTRLFQFKNFVPSANSIAPVDGINKNKKDLFGEHGYQLDTRFSIDKLEICV